MTGPRATTLQAALREQRQAEIARADREAEQARIHLMIAVAAGGFSLQPYPEGTRA